MDNPKINRAGDRHWYANGKLHRTDGPAAEYADGSKEWIINGNLHRTDGPACEWADGELWWCLNDTCYTFDKWLDENTYLTDSEKVMMKLQYG
jgi:hypothetical protein